ncbi:unnamed protein product [Peronospora farinosa]|uniref:Uncharacterized protein n=1 Tax=Peronospora farinosa TaxID=134698 RepID=A0AAV0SQN5_9STRA|nr:unnamed protein product [Peronospora farinosa]CAI5705400.1 unnamed protein product [Peronospora farinosa]
MRQYYFFLLLLAILRCTEGDIINKPIFIHAIDKGGTISRHLKGGETVTHITTDTKEEEERMPSLTGIAKETGAAKFMETNSVKFAETSKKIDLKEPGALRKFLGRFRAIDITGDKKGMLVAYSILIIALVAILMLGYSIQKHNQETYVH